eukprot:scaffold41247_cov222-Skeletonema_dohrnii-CCMP3373.AAC.1
MTNVSTSCDHNQHVTPKRNNAPPPPPPAYPISTNNYERETKRPKLLTPSPAVPKVKDNDQLIRVRAKTASVRIAKKAQALVEEARKVPARTEETRKKEEQNRKRKQQEAKEKRQLQMEKMLEADKELADKNKAMEDLEERTCVNCNIVKKKEEFDFSERKKGEDSVCMSCNEEQDARFREQHRMQREEDAKEHAEVIKVAAKENAENEANTIQKVKAAYEQYITKLKLSGSTIEKEMTRQSDLLYIVTSISRRGDQFGPCLHGVYTTCQKAQEAAREIFEKLSESYRGGEFVSDETRVAKHEGTSRPLFEVLWQDEDDQDCTAIAINAVRLGNDIEQSIPYIRGGSPFWLKHKPENEISSAGTTYNDSKVKVHLIFSYMPCNDWGEGTDVDLIGMYEDREGAMSRARAYVKDFIDEEQINDSYNSGVTNGELFVDEDRGSVSIETVILDNEHGG